MGKEFTCETLAEYLEVSVYEVHKTNNGNYFAVFCEESDTYLVLDKYGNCLAVFDWLVDALRYSG